MKTCSLPFLLCLFICSLAVPSSAADKVPKEMRPKLLREGKVILEDKFDGPELSPEWKVPKGEFAGTSSIEDGVMVIDSGTGKQGALRRMFATPLKDASVQLLMKPSAVNWMGVRFLSGDEEADRHWKVGTFIFAAGAVRVLEPEDEGKGRGNRVVKGAKFDLGADDWWRVCVEYRGKKMLVRVNGKEVMEVEHPGAADEKVGLLVNLYGGRGRVDEVVVMASGG
ncbi:MAG: hypothetical protein LDL31_06275 [Prosthecobacter sp.]|nr:hypothetical protein [Prosthecobacter sp.]